MFEELTSSLVVSSQKHPSHAPVLPVRVQTMHSRKRAVAKIRGGVIHIIVPKHWSNAFQTEVVQQLGQQVQSQFQQDFEQVYRHPYHGPMLSFNTQEDLETWVMNLNQRTFNVPVAKVRIGTAKYSHLAQMNLKTRVMTISRYCLSNVPESALTYLVIHELAHLLIPNHSRAFWNEVQRFVPDYRFQRHYMAAFHRVRLYEAETDQTLIPSQPSVLPPLPREVQKTSSASKPRKKPAPKRGVDFFQQLLNLFE